MADFLSTLATKVPANSASLVEYQRVGQGGEDIASELARLEGLHGRGSVSDDESAAPKANTLWMRSKKASDATEAPASEATGQLTRTEMSRQIQQEIDAKTTLLVEGGDAWFNAMYMHLPDGAKFEISMQWAAIGWAVPAAFGYGMGLEPDRRVISIIGDGGFQLSAQEVANMIRYGQNALIFLVNNRGYVSESEIHDGPYNLLQELGLRRLDGRMERRRWPRARSHSHNRRRALRCGQEGSRSQGWPGLDRMPDRARRLSLASCSHGERKWREQMRARPGWPRLRKGLSLDSAGQCFASRAIPICFRSESLFGSQFNYESNLRSCGLTALGSPSVV